MAEIFIRGKYRDTLLTPAGRPIFDSGWHSNMIVTNCRILLAGFMKSETAFGIRALHIGKGDPSWDTSPVAADAGISQLVDPDPFKVPIDDLQMDYLDQKDRVIDKPTNRIQILITLGRNQPDVPGKYPMREFGLFGELKGSPYMINYVRHPVIEKDASTIIERKIRLIF
jgi:hypothetical protein